MSRSIAKIAGIVLLIAGVAAAVMHYMLESDVAQSWMTFGIAAVLLILGWGLFDWGRGASRSGRTGKE